MDRNKELSTAYILWKTICELQNILFDHYGSEIIDMYVDEQETLRRAKNEENIDWPF
jgi:hypothetical protein